MRVRTLFRLVWQRATSRLPNEAGAKVQRSMPLCSTVLCPMQLRKVPAIVGQQNTAFGNRECKNLGVRYRRVCSSGVKRGEHRPVDHAEDHCRGA
jgi:hypothetical protein